MTRLPAGGVELHNWNIFIFTEPSGQTTEHFLGFDNQLGIGRLSTPIQSYDEKTGRGLTESGSHYQTTGSPGRPHPDAIYVLENIIGSREIEINFKYPSR